jgi:hypothetical protein
MPLTNTFAIPSTLMSPVLYWSCNLSGPPITCP